VTDYTTTKELVTDTGSGLPIKLLGELTGTWNVERGICDIQDGVEKLQYMYKEREKNSKQWNDWKNNGRKAVEKTYNWNHVTDEWVKLFDEMLEIKHKIPDEFYFKNRGIEVKHFIDAKNWKDFFCCKTAFEFGCGIGPRVYAMNFVGINARGSEISQYAVDNSIIKDKVIQEDIINSKYDKIEPTELVIAYDVLEHIPYKKLNDAINFLINRTTKHILISVPVIGDPNLEADPTHKIKKSKAWWKKKFTDKGLIEIDVPDNFLFKQQLMIFEVKDA